MPSPALAVPASLHASLMARLDRLGPAKEVAQVGAANGREFSHALLAAVARKPEAELDIRRSTASSRPVCCSGTACRRMQAICSNTRWCRTRPMARCCASRDERFTPASPRLSRHRYRGDRREPASNCWRVTVTEARLIEKAAGLWGKAGQRSRERSALLEAIEQLTRALDQIATLPGTPALRREQITLQIALLNPLQYVKGYGALEAKAAVERARLLIEQAEALGEPPEDPLLLFCSVLSAFWVTNWGTFNADALRELAAQYLALAEKQGATVPVLTGHYRIGLSLMSTGDIAQGRARFDHAIALYDPAEHRPLAMQFGHDMGVIILCWRSLALWMLGYPEGALADAEHALRDARATNHAATLMNALGLTAITHILCGNSAAAKALHQMNSSPWRTKKVPCSGRRSE